ncbi:hypothetical protein TNCV_468181 [Trichonephila clavipes]|nr:hypothetical protein TNCV_468181 [Trichonephila clavipes]
MDENACPHGIDLFDEFDWSGLQLPVNFISSNKHRTYLDTELQPKDPLQRPSMNSRGLAQKWVCVPQGLKWTLGTSMKHGYGDRFNSCQIIYSQFGLAIHQNDHQARRRFVAWAQNEIAVVPDFPKRILFSDEAHFWLNGYVNKQNCRICSEANPQVYVDTPLHPEKLTVW